MESQFLQSLFHSDLLSDRFGEQLASRKIHYGANEKRAPRLRVAPAAGRFFSPEEATKGAPCVVVLSHALWSSRFGASPAAVGRSIFVEGRSCSVVGVTPPGFSFPVPGTTLWLPFVIDPPQDPQQRGIKTFEALGRLRPGVTPR